MERYDPYEGIEPPKGGDQILALTAEFQMAKEENPDAINGVIGIYTNPSGEPYTPGAVVEAQSRLSFGLAKYLPSAGHEAFLQGAAKMIFGENAEVFNSGRIVAFGTPGGTGAVSLFAKLQRRLSPDRPVLMSDPTWPNHPQIFRDNDIPIRTYPHLNPDGETYNHSAFLKAIREAPPGTLVLFHSGRTHNPTGVNPTFIQWRELAEAMGGKQAFFDTAYPGFDEDILSDTEEIRIFVGKGIPTAVALSLSKAMALYKERVGSLFVVARDRAQADVIREHLTRIVRVHWSSPPAQGERIAAEVLCDPRLRENWEDQLHGIAIHIKERRDSIAAGLGEKFSFLKNQVGMFSLLPLTDEQVMRLKEEQGVFLLPGGDSGLARLSIPGVAVAQIERFCNAIKEVLATTA